MLVYRGQQLFILLLSNIEKGNAMNREDAKEIVISVLERNVDGIKISEDEMNQTLTEIGVDSLDIMLVMMDVSEASGVIINDDHAEDLDTPEKIINFIVG